MADGAEMQAAMQENRTALANNWICYIREVLRDHKAALDELGDEKLAFRRLCELNVVEQVNRLCRSTVVDNAWKAGKSLCIHGWIYDIGDGKLNDLGLCVTASSELDEQIASAVASSSKLE